MLKQLNCTERCALYVAAVAGLIAAAAQPLVMFTISSFLQTSIEEDELGAFLRLGAFVSALGLAITLMSSVKSGLSVIFSRAAFSKLGVLHFQAMLRQDISWFDKHASGERPHQLTNELSKVIVALSGPLVGLMSIITMIVFAMSLTIAFAWPLFVLLVSALPINALLMRRFGQAFTQMIPAVGAAHRPCVQYTSECFGGIGTVIAQGGEFVEIAKYAAALHHVRTVLRKSSSMVAFYKAALSVVTYVVIYLGFLGGAFLLVTEQESLVSGKQYTIQEIILAIVCTLVSMMPLANVVPCVNALMDCRASAKSIIELYVRGQQRVERDKHLVQLTKFESAIMSAVSFRYERQPKASPPAIKSLDLELLRSQKVALVGESGSGKSSVVNLMMRFYDPTGGDFLINGQPAKSVNARSLWGISGLVPQQPVLFSTSIRANILLGAGGRATESDLKRTCDLVRVTEFVEKLPAGFDTLCHSSNSNLSGGQKQRVALARALIVNPHVLLLDEATSALDNKSEREVLDAIRGYDYKIGNELSVLAVAHRLSTIWDSDIIYVMKDGAAIEKGSHDTLMQQGGVYAEMVEIQKINALSQSGVLPKTPTVRQSLQSKGVSDWGKKRSIQGILSVPASSSKRLLNIKGTKSHAVRSEMSTKSGTSSNGDVISTAESAATVFNAEAAVDADERRSQRRQAMLTAEHVSVTGIMKYGGPGMKMAFYKSNIYWMLTSLMPPLNGAFAMPAVITAIVYTPRDELMVTVALRGLSFIFLGFMSVVLTLLSHYNSQDLEFCCTFGLRVALYEHLLRQPLGFYSDPEHFPTTLVNLLTWKVRAVPSIIKNRSALFYKLSLVAWAMLLMFLLNWRLGFVGAVLLPFMIACMVVSMRVARSATNGGNLAGQALQVIADALANPRVVHAAGLEEGLVRLLRVATAERNVTRMALLTSAGSFINFGYHFGLAVFFVAAGYMVTEDMIEVFSIQGFFIMLILVTMGFTAPENSVGDVEQGRKVTVEVLQLLSIVPEINGLEPTGVSNADVKLGEIRLRRVTYAYDSSPNLLALRGMSFHIRSGMRVGVAGPSGGGKSTLFAMLHRYADPLVGDILIGEQALPLRLINIRWWRKQVSIVKQEPVLFQGTVRENVLYGLEDEGVSEEVLEECKAVARLDFLDRQEGDARRNSISSVAIPEEDRLGWDTLVGEKGTGLSGGQKQRVAICRALVRKAPVMLLDEATSALDVETEDQILQSMKKLMQGCTSLTIAHRLSTIVESDLIIIVHRGSIAEKGTHATLVEQSGGIYRDLVKGAQK